MRRSYSEARKARIEGRHKEAAKIYRELGMIKHARREEYKARHKVDSNQ